MNVTGEMLRTNPERPILKGDVLEECIRACLDCSQACVSCADACLSEPEVQNQRLCIRLNSDCADICDVTARVLSRLHHPDVEVLRAQLAATIASTRACAAECERHAKHMEHCRVCAEACRACEGACEQLLNALPGATEARH